MKQFLTALLMLCLIGGLYAQDQGDNPKAKKEKRENQIRQQFKLEGNGNVQIIIEQGGEIIQNIDEKDRKQIEGEIRKHLNGNEPLIIVNGEKIEGLPKNINKLIQDQLKRQLDNPNKQLLDRFDKDGDGKLNEKEKAAAKDAMDKGMADGLKQVNKMLERFDNGDIDLNNIQNFDFRSFNREEIPGLKEQLEKDGFQGEGDPKKKDTDDDHFEGVL